MKPTNKDIENALIRNIELAYMPKTSTRNTNIKSQRNAENDCLCVLIWIMLTCLISLIIFCLIK